MRILHLVKVYFWRSSTASDDWLRHRFALFREQTLRSLQMQTFQDFRIWFHCQPGMRELMAELRPHVPQGSVFTFGEHFPESTDLHRDDYDDLMAGKWDYVYVTRLDSDDLYCNSALQIISEVRPQHRNRIEAAFFRRGYLHDLSTGRTGVYFNPSSPFHTLMFPTIPFVVEPLYQQSFVGDHSQVRGSYPSQDLPDWKFCVLAHGRNTTTDFNYSREDLPVEKEWSMDRFLKQPVVFDVDDFCDKWNCLPDLDALREVYPKFRATLFTIPELTSHELRQQVYSRPWLELAVHGITHEPNEEMRHVPYTQLKTFLSEAVPDYKRLFRPPGWFLSRDTVEACNDAGFAVAMHVRDREQFAQHCQHGHYCCDDRLPYWHGHTHDVCGNWLHGHLETLKTKWPRDQAFSFVSDAVFTKREA